MRSRRRFRPAADLNVTPLVDVMLVLLIVFIATAPAMMSGVKVDLPKTSAAPVNAEQQPITVSVKEGGALYLGDERVTGNELIAHLQKTSHNDSGRRIFVRGDAKIDYGQVMKVMGQITASGFSHVALLAEPPPVDQ